MSSKAIREFLQDERGGYTMWSVVWFLLYVTVGGLAVDATDAFRNQTLLQATADSAALAAVMSIGVPGEDPVQMADDYAADNMDQSHNGDVLVEADITLGVWDFDNRTFTPGAVPTNAVHVATRRSTDNANPVAMNFLRILGVVSTFVPLWDVAAESVAVSGVSVCHNGGLIAGGTLSLTTGNGFFENICLHGVGGLILRNDNYFESGVAASTGCTDCVGPEGHDPSVNEGWAEAWMRGGENDPLFPLNAYAVGEYVDALKALPDTANYSDMLATYGANYAGWDYLYHPDGSPPARYTGSSLPATLDPYTIYQIDCPGNEMTLPTVPMRNIGIIVDCRIKVPERDGKALDMVDVVLAVDWFPDNKAQEGIHMAENGNFGNGDCTGGVELYTNGSSIHFASLGNVNNVRLLSGWNIKWASDAAGQLGIHAEAVNNIEITSDSEFGLCPGSTPNGPNQYTYRLVF